MEYSNKVSQLLKRFVFVWKKMKTCKWPILAGTQISCIIPSFSQFLSLLNSAEKTYMTAMKMLLPKSTHKNIVSMLCWGSQEYEDKNFILLLWYSFSYRMSVFSLNCGMFKLKAYFREWRVTFPPKVQRNKR